MLNNPLNKPVFLLNSICLVVVLFLLIGNVFFAVKYFGLKKELSQTKIALDAQKTNQKVLDFTKIFIREVLKSETEIDFDTRLKLKTAVKGAERRGHSNPMEEIH
ncbi:MAG: hypothetical protein A3F95_03035 [Candidatus Nealsonbacteria bacterium RIFCSPLOWO2_12_FULL_39_31]|uniref:Uncharacterized protein n=3 Tax=Candidatus Nealsoniibacteriota TaxID=1817911 RepID=A0A1G2EKY2_9BACT|nr:MAG: hypothetical protein US88_C0004G0010 [Parcubacteria group bacterium GW2011_GWA2_38_27]KKQ97312.1 MAG: hypothetical protein UT22_C0013G0008 [Parcubacteria group bacterium GW2011_GWC2_39_11]OGZ19426.1 MAG: hypothetical protein A2626_02390 [Candidatus Nealsonbacteria bacterium RIFCSPHIGHO2_01_FULL_38_55]OGZ20594.1 MAG: hypothetical protein A2W55_01610 [Candidatus Nealsonbacteria bacterium RIFCSPHIGHO2_02_38_10]OGZ21697.1 MAG: hypothetical protein A3C48_02810 [Candidatus Nealsonbacteria bac